MTRRLIAVRALSFWLGLLVWSFALNAAGQKLIIGGAQSLAPLAEKYSSEFRQNHPAVEIEIRRANSNYALDAVRKGEISVGLIARNVAANERTDLQVAPLGHDPIILLSYPWNPVANLTLAQLRQIYLGKITSWKEVGGADQGIVPLTREPSASLHKIFVDCLFGNQGAPEKAYVLRANKDKVLRTIKRIRGSLGYGIVRLEEAEAESVTVMAIDGKPPSAANIRSGLYPLMRPQLAIAQRSAGAVAQEWLAGFEKFARREPLPEKR